MQRQAFCLLLCFALYATAVKGRNLQSHLSLIGIPLAIAPYKHLQSRFEVSHLKEQESLLLALTEANIIAALNTTSGATVWRQYFPESEFLTYLQCSADDVISLSIHYGSICIRSISKLTGKTRWESRILLADTRSQQANIACSSTVLGGKPTVHENVLVSSGSSATYLSTSTGEIVFQADIALGQDDLEEVLSATRDSIALVAKDQDQRTYSTCMHLTPEGYFSAGTVEFGADFMVLSDSNSSLSAKLIWLSHGSLRSKHVCEDMVSYDRITNNDEYFRLVDIGLTHRGLFIAQSRTGQTTLYESKNGTIRKLWYFSDATLDSKISGSVDHLNQPHVGVFQYSATLQLGSLQIFSPAASDLSAEGMMSGYTFNHNVSKYGSVASAAFDIVASTNHSYIPTSRLLVTSVTGTLQLWQGSSCLWTREEGISSIDTTPIAYRSSLREPFVDRNRAKTTSYRSFGAKVEAQLSNFSDRLSGSIRISQHDDTTTILIVGSSKFKTFYGLNSDRDMSLAWRTIIPATTGATVEIHSTRLLPHPLQRTILVEIGEKAKHNGSKVLHHYELDAKNGVIQNHHLAVSCRSVVHTSSLEHSRISKAVEPPGAPQIKNSREIMREDLWHFVIPDSETITNFSGHRNGIYATLGRVLGNRSTLMKQANPYLVGIQTKDVITNDAHLYILDTGSGALIYQIRRIPDEDQSTLRAVMRNNWLLLSYRKKGDLGRRSHIVSVEFYLAGEADTLPQISSLVPSEHGMYAISRSFVSPNGLQIVDISATKLGITSASAIFANQIGQMLSVPYRALDPRRPFQPKPSREDQEEMLTPYEPILKTDPLWTFFGEEAILGVSKASVHEGHLESEAYVFGYGLDCTFAILSPSRSYDLLSPTFNKTQLLITGAFLILMLSTLSRLVRLSA